MAETKDGANAAFDFFIAAYGVKYQGAVKCLTRDRADLLAFYDFPTGHWQAHPDQQPDDPHLCHRTGTEPPRPKAASAARPPWR